MFTHNVLQTQLNVHNRIGHCLCQIAFHARAVLFNDFPEHLVSELLTLIMPNDSNLYFLLMVEVFMIVHLACDKRIGTGCNRIAQHEGTSSATNGHLTNRPLKQLVGLNTFHGEHPLEHLDERHCIHRLLKNAYHTTGSYNFFGL